MAIEDYLTRSAGASADSFEWGQIEWFDGSGVTAGEGLTVARVTIESGKSNSPHRHPNAEEILYLLSGEIDHSLGDEVVTLNPGDLLHVPQGEPHGATTTSEEDAVMLVAYNTDEREIEFVD